MSMNNINKLSVVLVMSVILGSTAIADARCDKRAPGQAKISGQKPVTSAPAERADKAQLNSSHRVRSPGKNSAGLEIVKPARYKLDNGEAATLTLVVRVTEDIEQLTVQPNVAAGLMLVNGTAARQSGPHQAGDLVELSFDVVAMSEGLHYVNAVLTSSTAAGKRMTSYSIAAEVGDVQRALAAKPKADIRVDSTGRKVRVLRALESDALTQTHIQ